ncbi:MAG TPA: transposase [Chitinispirillaceae bacterium]|nr:transposase [Chitinispirillaceae bacterium]
MALELGVIKREELETPPVTKTVTYDRTSRKKPETTIKGHGRGKMPDHLRIDEQVIEPEGDISGKVRIGEEVTWYFEMSAPSSLHVVMITRPKYAFPDNSGVVIGALPPLPVEKGNAGPSLLTQIVVDKFLYHIPLYRQIAKYKSEYNVDFSESWFSDNVKNATFWLESAHDKHKIRLLQSDLLQADETPIPVLVKDGKGKTHRGYLWVYRDPINKIVIFDYRPNRSRAGPSDFLKDFKGTLQIGGYCGLFRNNYPK